MYFFAVILGIAFLCSAVELEDRNKKIRGVVNLLGLLAVFLFLSPVFIEFNGLDLTTPKHQKTAVYTFNDDGQITRGSNIAVICWEKCANSPTEVNITNSVQPITENPKVRSLSYELKVEVIFFNKFFNTKGLRPKDGHIPTISENKQIIEELVQYHLYEFNNEYSKELAQFYNPLDKTQQTKLYQMIAKYVNPKIGEYGLSVEELVSFSVH